MRDALITLLTTHASAMVKVQHSSGAWHQVLNETSTFLETSVTAMTMFSIARGIARGERGRNGRFYSGPLSTGLLSFRIRHLSFRIRH
jgi:rhamnogalacturonyl hydrolase YesR